MRVELGCGIVKFAEDCVMMIHIERVCARACVCFVDDFSQGDVHSI